MIFRKALNQFLRDESGATAVEYGLIASLVVIASLGAIQSVADENTAMWSMVSSQIVENINN